MRGDSVASFDLPTVLRFAELALAALGEAREEIDALNVYPVPDGDTGTNMFLTFEAARDSLLDALGDDRRRACRCDLRTAMAAFARGALLGARGNSGVILSQLVGALFKRLAAARPEDRSAEVFAEGMALATEASYAAVGTPVEGTILSVARAAAEAAPRPPKDPDARLGHVVRGGGRRPPATALARTPDQLQTLRTPAWSTPAVAGCAWCSTPPRRRSPVAGPSPRHHALGVARHPGAAAARATSPPDGPGLRGDVPPRRRRRPHPDLRTALAPLGDSLVVVGGDGLWNVHVHVDDVGAAVEAGIEAGRPHRVRVTHFAEQSGREPRAARQAAAARVVAVAAGAGLGDLFVRGRCHGRPGRSGPTAARPARSSRRSAAAGAAEVIVLPNDRDSVAAAEAAARTARETEGVRVAVIPTNAQVQGLAALAVHEPGRSFEQDIVEMTAAARHARSGAVTVAARHAMTTAGPCEPGDVLGVDRGRLRDRRARPVRRRRPACSSGSSAAVARWSRSWPGPAPGDLAERCAAYLAEARPTVDVVVYDGGQPRLPPPRRCRVGASGDDATSGRRLSATIGWDDRLETVAGKHASKIEKAFGYRTVGDLLGHYPRRYVDKGSLSDLSGSSPTSTSPSSARVQALASCTPTPTAAAAAWPTASRWWWPPRAAGCR